MTYDVLIIGAGASGLMCAMEAGKRKLSVLVIDHNQAPGGKIPISGGGHCNFSNREISPQNYVSNNPHFCKSALSRYPTSSFLTLLEKHRIAFHEKDHGQLFCNGSARLISNMLFEECKDANVKFQMNCQIKKVSKTDEKFITKTSTADFTSKSLVIATGGLSIPKIGATGLGYEIAKQFGLKIIEPRPALDSFTFDKCDTEFLSNFSGISLPCKISCNNTEFEDDLLFTHQGLSGPAALQASLYWNIGNEIMINLLPHVDVFEWLVNKKKDNSRSMPKNLIAELLPTRLAEYFADQFFKQNVPLAQTSDKILLDLSAKIQHWKLKPSGTTGFTKAEVTRGGVDTDELSSKTMETRKIARLYFIGEVVDVTGWLGGYNLHWAWASGSAAGHAI